MTTEKTRRQFPGGRRGKMIFWGVMGAAWLGVLVGVAVPSWRQTVAQHHEVRQLEQQLADLDTWTVAGLWLEKSLAPRRAAIDPQWDRLFPSRPEMGELFLDLAQVADRSGVQAFELREVVLPTDGSAPPPEGGDVPLASHRVLARFEGQYAQVAEFLGGLKSIERALSVHNLAIKPVREAVRVDLELEVYVSKTNQS